MAYFEGYKCDVAGCNNVRQPSNGWFIGKFDGERLEIIPLNDADAKGGKCVLLCGENCVQKYVSTNLPYLHKKDAETE